MVPSPARFRRDGNGAKPLACQGALGLPWDFVAGQTLRPWRSYDGLNSSVNGPYLERTADSPEGSAMKLAQHRAGPGERLATRVDRACHDVNTSLSTIVLCIEFLAERSDAVREEAVKDA